MISYRNYFQRSVMFILCSLLTLILAACAVGGDYTPVATPVPSPSIPLHLHTFRGPGYTIGYPQNWIVTRTSDGSVTFSDPHGLAYMSIEVLPNPGGALFASVGIAMTRQVGAFKVSNYNRGDIPLTTTLNGDTWSQRAATGNITIKDRSTTMAGKMVAIADNHPASSPATKIFVIAYAAAQEVFDVADTTYFQPILQSFRFI